MSALLAPFETAKRRTATRPNLRAVRLPGRRIGTMPFVMLLASVLAVGLVGLLILNTTLQSQVFVLHAAQQRATELSYRVSDLESRVNRLHSPLELARSAYELGMRPNPYGVYLMLPSGRIVGTPRKVTGSELPNFNFKTLEEIQAEAAAAEAARAAAQAAAEAEAKAAEAAAAAKAAQDAAAAQAALAAAARAKAGGR